MTKQYKKMRQVLCLLLASLMLTNIVYAKDDNPVGETISLFPTPEEALNDYRMDKNYGTITFLKSPAEVNYNKGTITNLEGATVWINDKDGIITDANSGLVNVNNGKIDRVYGNSIVIKQNGIYGIIENNLDTVELNMGSVINHYGTIKENRGDITNLEQGSKVEEFIEGVVAKNDGTITIVPQTIITSSKIITNDTNGKVIIKSDPNNKSTVTIENNKGEIQIENGADCIVIDNNGTINLETGASVTVLGTNNGTINGGSADPDTDDYYELILDNIATEDFEILSNYKIDGGITYVVSGDKEFSFKYNKDKYYLLVKPINVDDSYSYITTNVILNNFADKNYVDTANEKVTLHFHTRDTYVPSFDGDVHQIKCNCGENIDTEDHTYGEWIVVNDSTYDTEGQEKRVCTLCSHNETRTIPVKTRSSHKKKKNNDANTIAKDEPLDNINDKVDTLITNKFIDDYINCQRNDTCPLNKFKDVNINEWYHDGIHFCFDNEIMIGTDNNTYAANETVLRAQIAMILYNLEGKPEVKNKNSFVDVPKDMWYSDAIAWAKNNNIINGYLDGSFAPDKEITCEEFTTILYNYSKYKNYDITINEDTNFLSYNDFADISEWAITPMMWAIQNDLIKGTDENNLNPKENLLRERVATIIFRFCKNIDNK